MSVVSVTSVAMPRLSDSMEEGTIVRWLKRDRDVVVAGEPIIEIETDKATMEYEAEAAGVLEILAPEGATVPLGGEIARIVPAGTEPEPAPRRDRVLATPIARRLAADLGIELSSVQGTGRRGHIVKADVEALVGNGSGRPPLTPADTSMPADVSVLGDVSPRVGVSASPPRDGRNARRQELTRVQQRIAARMAESRAVVPDFALEVEIEMGPCLELRRALAEYSATPPSINDMIIKACALALAEHPRVNGSYRDGGFDLYEQINVGIAVAAEDALIVPVVHDADRKSLGEIARTTRSLAARVRGGEITPPELAGATFTVSNLGMYGIARFTAVINPPQAAILAVGAVEPRAVVRDGELAIAETMTATLASDHRILYGADAAQFLADIRKRLQAPMSLLI